MESTNKIRQAPMMKRDQGPFEKTKRLSRRQLKDVPPSTIHVRIVKSFRLTTSTCPRSLG